MPRQIVMQPAVAIMGDRSSSSFTILVVDDDLMIAEVKAALLEDLDHSVIIANSADEAAIISARMGPRSIRFSPIDLQAGGDGAWHPVINDPIPIVAMYGR